MKSESSSTAISNRPHFSDIIPQHTLAEPEKAILDHWHLTPGEWNEARLMEMRYQNLEAVDRHRLAEYAERFASPRLKRAAKRWSTVAGNAEIGAVTL